MKFTPREYQSIAARYIRDNPRCALWAEMGLGKTSSVLLALTQLDLMEDVFPALVLAPLRVARTTWPDEVEKWDDFKGLRIRAICGTPAERSAALAPGADVYTINYENIPWLVEALKGEWPFKTVISDESTKLKSFRTKQGGMRARVLSEVAFRSRRWVNLTGTPSPNGLTDLWGQTWFLDKGERLGKSFTSFTDRWFRTDFNGFGLRPLPNAEKDILERLQNICLSLRAADWFDLKLPIVNTVPVDLPPEARKQYKRMEDEMFMELEGVGVEAFNAAAVTMKCLQLANGAAYLDDGSWVEVHKEKLDALEDILEEAAGAPVLVAYHFRSDLERLRKRFTHGRVLDKNPGTVKDWNAGRIPVLFAHPASAGHGLNLQHGGNIVAFFAHNWNLEEQMQLMDRIGPVRQLQSGYNRPVFVHHIVARKTIEETVMAVVGGKRSRQDALMEAVNARR